MLRSYSFTWVLVSLLSLTLAVPLQADITPSGDVSPSGSWWWTSGGDSATYAYIGKTAAGSVTVNLGSDLISGYGCIGDESGVAGVVTVDGSGSTWTNSGDYYDDGLCVGRSGQGMLNITNGGAVHNIYGYIGYHSGSIGVVTVDGIGSTWTCSGNLYVGHEGHGTLNITNGGAVSAYSGYIDEGDEDDYSTIYIGCEASSFGEVTVDGGGSIWTNNGNLTVGSYYSQGILNITNSGTVSNYGGTIGGSAGSTGEVTVDGSSSTWTNSRTLEVGTYGQATLNITNGGAVSCNRGAIGIEASSTSVVTVDGIGSTWTCSGDYENNLTVGDYGQGTLNITGGGLVSVAGILTIDYNGDGDSFINMATGGMLALYGDADDSLDDFLNLISGTDAIRYWDDSASDWADITGATRDEDYTLIYQTEGDLAGYTMLTVPEPATMLLLAFGGLAMLKRRR